MRFSGIITLLTDFGYDDPYVASMKGIIYSINPHVNIVDITHNIPPHEIKLGSIVLWSTYKYFPRGTIHVAVVDPGVGTSRKPIVIYSENYLFIGPDNGVLTLAANEDHIKEVYEIVLNSKYVSERISYTFHGRDVFAPIAAYLSRGEPIERLAKKTTLTQHIGFPKYEVGKSQITGEVIYIDRFGNLITNIPGRVVINKLLTFYQDYEIFIGDKQVTAKLVKAYGEVKKGKPLLIINSFNLLELSINLGNAAKKYRVKIGDKVIIKR